MSRICKKKNSSKVFLANETRIILRDLQAEKSEEIALDLGYCGKIASDPHMDRVVATHAVCFQQPQ